MRHQDLGLACTSRRVESRKCNRLMVLTKSDAIAVSLFCIFGSSRLCSIKDRLPVLTLRWGEHRRAKRTYTEPAKTNAKSDDGLARHHGESIRFSRPEPCDTDNYIDSCPHNSKQGLAEAERDRRETQVKASRQNPSGRNRTSDQLISENTETQYSTLQSIALPTELHSVISLLPQQTHTTA